MVSKFKFVRYGHIEKKLALYVPWFNSDGPLKSEVFHFKKISSFVLALEQKVFKLEGFWNQALYICPKGVILGV